MDASTKTAADAGSRHVGDKPTSEGALKGSGAEEWPDYSKGPSALDKASQLFFFTEIVRGE
jgi:NADH dehydrogenase (ubiquinone) Fe-S protein 8